MKILLKVSGVLLSICLVGSSAFSEEIKIVKPDLSDHSLVSYWSFNNTLKDLSCNKNNLTAHGKIVFEQQGIRLNGVDTYLSVPFNRSFDMSTSDFTIATWIKLFSIKLQTGLINHIGPTYWVLDLGRRESIPRLEMSIRYGVEKADRLDVYSKKTFSLNEWHHIAVVIDRDSEITFYIDGEKAGSYRIRHFKDKDITTSNTPIVIGKHVNYLDGIIAGMEIYKEAKTSDWIKKRCTKKKYYEDVSDLDL